MRLDERKTLVCDILLSLLSHKLLVDNDFGPFSSFRFLYAWCRLHSWPEVKSDGTMWIEHGKWAVTCFFCSALAPLVYKVERHEGSIKIKRNRENLTFVDLWWPDLWSDHKMNQSYFLVFFLELSSAAYCVTLVSPWTELEDVQTSHQHKGMEIKGKKL